MEGSCWSRGNSSHSLLCQRPGCRYYDDLYLQTIKKQILIQNQLIIIEMSSQLLILLSTFYNIPLDAPNINTDNTELISAIYIKAYIYIHIFLFLDIVMIEVVEIIFHRRQVATCPSQRWPRFNIKMSPYHYTKSHCGDMTVVRPSYLHNGISYTGKWSRGCCAM